MLGRRLVTTLRRRYPNRELSPTMAKKNPRNVRDLQWSTLHSLGIRPQVLQVEWDDAIDVES